MRLNSLIQPKIVLKSSKRPTRRTPNSLLLSSTLSWIISIPLSPLKTTMLLYSFSFIIFYFIIIFFIYQFYYYSLLIRNAKSSLTLNKEMKNLKKNRPVISYYLNFQTSQVSIQELLNLSIMMLTLLKKKKNNKLVMQGMLKILCDFRYIISFIINNLLLFKIIITILSI